jgi:hypothetical protein
MTARYIIGSIAAAFGIVYGLAWLAGEFDVMIAASVVAR